MKYLRRIAPSRLPPVPASLLFMALVTPLGGCTTAGMNVPPAASATRSLRWVGPTHVPLVMEPNERARDLAALGAVLTFWGRVPADRSAPAAQHDGSWQEPLLAGDLERVARAAGLSAFAFHGTLDDVVYELHAGRPVIVSVVDSTTSGERTHYEVVVACDPGARRLKNLDPARGFVERTYAGFQDDWGPARQLTLVLFEPEPAVVAAPPPVATPLHMARR